MELAYTDAAGRSSFAVLDLGAGLIGGMTLEPGLYKFGNSVHITSDVTLTGEENDVIIIQVGTDLILASTTYVILGGALQAKNIFWQVGGAAEIGAGAHMEGTVMTGTISAMKTSASITGRLLAQTAVTLQMNTVTMP
jgi:hypothetical protein